MIEEIDLLTGLGTWALVVITGLAVFVGWKAAKSANDTFRIESEARLVVSFSEAAQVFAREGLHRVIPRDLMGCAPTAEQCEALDNGPLFIVDGREGADGRRLIVNGFDIRFPTAGELHRLGPAQVPIWRAIRVQIHNVGRSPAVQVGLHWQLSGAVFVDKFPPRVAEQTDNATTVIDAIGANDKICIWLANATGTNFTLTLKSPGYQRDPFDLDSGKTRPIQVIALSTFQLRS